ncbi:MAG: mucoidy inhibitor MuiA family protein [Breznakibacter sp.]|nr:mucoidy inhibitor MuiA family protein [Breznakibacter sp.]
MKKNFTIIIFALLSISLTAQEFKEITVKSEVNEVTVFINGARVVRNKTIELPAGKNVVKFTELSPFIDTKTIQVIVKGNPTVLSVNHQFNYTDSASRSQQVVLMDNQLKEFSDKIKIENTKLEITNEAISFLAINKNIGGKNESTSLVTLKETAEYFKQQMEALKMEQIQINKRINELNERIQKIQLERLQITSRKSDPQGEVLVKLDSDTPCTSQLELSYYVSNAGWFPTYDIRANSISDPIALVYKANVHQNTKEEWKNVRLKFSSGDPKRGAVAPQLQTYYLNYSTLPPSYKPFEGNQVTGFVFDAETGEPLVGTSINITGTTIGTVTNLEGKYSLSIPNNKCLLSFSNLGYITELSNVAGANMNIYLNPDNESLEEVVVIGYGTTNNYDSEPMIMEESRAQPAPSKARKIASQNKVPSVEQVETTTLVEFEIKKPYLIHSDNKLTTVEMESFELDADFEYFSIPKIDSDAFLRANITEWQKLNLLDGEANLFYENTFVGKTVLDTRGMKDTLSLSLGRDRSVQIKRDKSKDLSSSKLFGSKRETERNWMISVKNGKKAPIKITLQDQIPVSTLDEIEVITDELSGGELKKESGEITWKLNLEPNEKRELNLKYRIKYPKERKLFIE